MGEWEWFRRILEQSVEKNGEVPLTNKYLLNIVKMADRQAAKDGEISEAQYYKLMEAEYKWGGE